MQEQSKYNYTKEMHKYVWGLIGIFFLIVASYPVAIMRVSQSKKFAGFHVKSFTIEGKLPNNSTESVAVALNDRTNTSQSSINYNPTVFNQFTNSSLTIGPTNDTTFLEKVKTSPIASLEEIDDPDLIKELNQKVYNQIAEVWQAGHSLKKALTYRVTVTADGTIASYEPLFEPALNYVLDTPLPSLVKSSVNQAKASTNQGIGQFKVVFTNRGILEVSPWHGWRKK